MLLELLASAVTGGSSGVVGGWLIVRRAKPASPPDWRIQPDTEPDFDVPADRIAALWTGDRDRAQVARLIASKLRLGYGLHRARRQSPSWRDRRPR
jgi:hypothetical protein